jgi:GAF domain-containing protein
VGAASPDEVIPGRMNWPVRAGCGSIGAVTDVTGGLTADVLAAVRDRNRLAALRRLVMLDTPPTPAFDRLTRLTAQLLEVPVALLSFVDEDRHWVKSDHGLPAELRDVRHVPLTHSFCRQVVAAGERVTVPDTLRYRAFRHHPLVAQAGIRAYAGSPVHSPDGYVVGALCAVDVAPRRWEPEAAELLDDLAAIATREVALHVHERRDAHRRLWGSISLPYSTS